MYTFLVNPASRSGRGRKYWDCIKPVLEEKGIEYQVLFSEKSGDMTRFAARLTEQLEREDREVHLVALGGDGTVNEVLQGIHDFDRTLFSYIPTGSSNDLARDTGISREPLKALEQLLSSGKEHRMDVGVLHYNTAYSPNGQSLQKTDRPERYFLVSCGIGFDAGVCQEAMASSIKDTLNRLGLGKLTYLGIALKQLITSRRTEAWLTLDEGNTISLPRLMFIACMSHCYEGGGFYFCPGADAADGILDLCTACNLPKWKAVLILPTAFWGGHFRYNGVERYKGSRLQIRTSRPLWVHTDGEVNALSDDITLTCHRKRLRFIY